MIFYAAKFMARQRKRSKWIKGPLRDWLIPYKYNWWFQFGHVLFFGSILCIVLFFITKNVDVLKIAGISLFVSVAILGGTEFGKGTVNAYRRARNIIKREGELGTRLQKKFGQKMYCYRAGARAAAIEYDLSQKLIPALANKWRLI